MIILLEILIFLNALLFIIIILTGGIIMATIQQAIIDLNAAIAALQGRLGSGVVVQQSDLDSVAASIASATTTIGTIAA